eukprot:GEMP01079167.1.p1 GENE.GEMP01079167.1~~GEMP01079167.1.p1  ORF type:complete len:156 (+),score=34.14 GEMP01079167.1:55-522(+)
MKLRPEEHDIRVKLEEECQRRTKLLDAQTDKAPRNEPPRNEPPQAMHDASARAWQTEAQQAIHDASAGAKSTAKRSDKPAEETMAKVELMVGRKRKIVDLPVTSTMLQIIESFGKRILGDSCVVLHDNQKQDLDRTLSQLPGEAPWRLVFQKNDA